MGKTHIATGLAVRVIQDGFSAAFMSADELIEQLRRDDATANRRIRRRKHMNKSLLIIYEIVFQALDRCDARLLFKVISYRFERGGTFIASNESIRQLPGMLAGDDALAKAILDRLLQRSRVNRRQELKVARNRKTFRRRLARRRAGISGPGAPRLRLRCRPHLEVIGQ